MEWVKLKKKKLARTGHERELVLTLDTIAESYSTYKLVTTDTGEIGFQLDGVRKNCL